MHRPLEALQLANWWHWKSSRWQLKHGGQPSGRSSKVWKYDGVRMPVVVKSAVYLNFCALQEEAKRA